MDNINQLLQGLNTITGEEIAALLFINIVLYTSCAIWELLDYAQYYICHKRYHDKKVRQLLEQIERNQGNEKT